MSFSGILLSISMETLQDYNWTSTVDIRNTTSTNTALGRYLKMCLIFIFCLTFHQCKSVMDMDPIPVHPSSGPSIGLVKSLLDNSKDSSKLGCDPRFQETIFFFRPVAQKESEFRIRGREWTYSWCNSQGEGSRAEQQGRGTNEGQAAD